MLTDLLRQALAQAERRSPAEQDHLGACLLNELLALCPVEDVSPAELAAVERLAAAPGGEERPLAELLAAYEQQGRFPDNEHPGSR